jgi:hypothetical protein
MSDPIFLIILFVWKSEKIFTLEISSTRQVCLIINRQSHFLVQSQLTTSYSSTTQFQVEYLINYGNLDLSIVILRIIAMPELRWVLPFTIYRLHSIKNSVQVLFTTSLLLFVNRLKGLMYIQIRRSKMTLLNPYPLKIPFRPPTHTPF